MNETLIFCNKVPLTFSTFIPVSFPLIETPIKLLFRYEVKIYHHISFNVLYILKSYPWGEFNFRKQKKGHSDLGVVNMERVTLVQFCVSPKIVDQKVSRIGTASSILV